jgi:glycosyltransferase involved in cell wall biosynthesis
MRIGISGLFWEQPATGTGQYLHALVRAMVEQEAANEYLIVVPRDPTPGDSIYPLKDFAARAFLYPERTLFQRVSENLAKLHFEQDAFPRACAREHAAIAHVPHFAAPLVSRTPVVVTIHDLIPMILPAYRGAFLVRMYTRLVALTAKRARAIITDSHASKADIVRILRVDADRVFVVHLAADERYRPVEDPAPIASVRQRYNLPEKFILYLGGYDQRKNVRVLLEAFTFLDDLYAEGWRLVFAGAARSADSAFFPDPRRMSRELALPEDAVQFVGWVREEDKPALYSAARLFVFPSLYEGFGLPPLEATACGTPVVVSNTASLPEVVGDAGLQLAPSDALFWAEGIRQILRDEARWQAMRAAGLEQARKFSWSRAARETLAVYRKVAGRVDERG